MRSAAARRHAYAIKCMEIVRENQQIGDNNMRGTDPPQEQILQVREEFE